MRDRKINFRSLTLLDQEIFLIMFDQFMNAPLQITSVNHISCHGFYFITALIELELPFCLVCNFPFLNVASLDRFYIEIKVSV